MSVVSSVVGMELEERSIMDDDEAGELSALLDHEEPEVVLDWALERFGPERLVFVTSFQMDGMVLIDMASRLVDDFRVVTVDTERLPQESLEFIEQVGTRYGIDVEIHRPDPSVVSKMTTKHGRDLFYEAVDFRLLCCHVRKIMPLQEVLLGADAWVTGMRRDQWATRANIRKVEVDHDHGGLVKLNPLADWPEQYVQDYIKANDVPVHPLYERGYTTIGCAPCSRPVKSGDDPRSGRWWWETNAPKECGMHCPIETGGFEHEVESLLGHDVSSYWESSDGHGSS